MCKKARIPRVHDNKEERFCVFICTIGMELQAIRAYIFIAIEFIKGKQEINNNYFYNQKPYKFHFIEKYLLLYYKYVSLQESISEQKYLEEEE